VTKKDPLGRGLSAIFRDIEERGASRLIPVNQIKPGSTQPRLSFREEPLAELAASIKEKGVLQPLILRKKEKGFEIVAGERRFRAALIAGLVEVPAFVKDVDDREALEIGLIENLQREDLNSVEVAMVYEKFIEEFEYTHEELAKRIGVDRSSVSNHLRLLKLPEWIKEMIMEGKLTEGHARVLISLPGEREQKRFVDRVLKEGMSVRELERQVRKTKTHRESPFPHIEDTLRKALGTKVNITYRRNKGKIIVEFFSKEDLERITDLIEGN
jgi:ParB family chromosome partitioning protein